MKRIIYVNDSDLEKINEWLVSGDPVPDASTAEVIKTFTAVFPGGIEADIKVCNGDDGAWVDSVLFVDGCEVHTLEPWGGMFEGEYPFQYKDKPYMVEVMKKPFKLMKIESAAEFQADQCRDDLIEAEFEVKSALSRIAQARNDIRTPKGEAGIAIARNLILEAVKLLASAQSSHGKLMGATEALKAFTEV